MTRIAKTAPVLLALMLAMLPAMAGCMTASAATVKANQGEATDAARSQWSDDAELVAAIGLEGTNAEGDEYSPWGAEQEADARNFFASARDDGDVGDGRCEVWGYVYASASKPGEFYAVFVDKDGQRQGTFSFEEDDDDLVPIGDFDVNSDEAIDIAKDANEGIATAMESDDRFVVMALARPDTDQNPVWVVVAGAAGSGDGRFGFVMIDAKTGEVLASFDNSDGGGFGGFGGF
jgi:hypothetical protein